MFVGKLLKTSAFVGGILIAATALVTAPASFWPGVSGVKAHEASGHGHGEGDGHDAHGDHDDGHDHSDGKHAHGNIIHGDIDDYPGQERTVARYTAPDVTLRDQNNERVRLSELLSEDRPAALQFIFTSCSTLCPVLTATMAQAEDELVAMSEDIRLISISIDPEHDTPERLNEYSGMHQAGPNWTFLTGSFDDILQVVRAFDAVYESNNKMYHKPFTYLRSGAEEPWLRIEAILSAGELIEAYGEVLNTGSTKALEKAAID